MGLQKYQEEIIERFVEGRKINGNNDRHDDVFCTIYVRFIWLVTNIYSGYQGQLLLINSVRARERDRADARRLTSVLF